MNDKELRELAYQAALEVSQQKFYGYRSNEEIIFDALKKAEKIVIDKLKNIATQGEYEDEWVLSETN